MDIFTNISVPPSRLNKLQYGGILDLKFSKKDYPLLKASGLLGQCYEGVELLAKNKICSLQQFQSGNKLQDKDNPELELRVDCHSPIELQQFFNRILIQSANVRTRLVPHQDRFTMYRPKGF